MRNRISSLILLLGVCISVRGEIVLDVSNDYSTNSNPNPIWSYGYKPTLGGVVFSPLPYSLIQDYGPNSVIHRWLETPAGGAPSVQKNLGPYNHQSTVGQFNIAPGVVWFGPGSDSEDAYCVIRCVIPADGRYRLTTAVRTYIQGPLSGDCDFHVLKNGAELFGEFMPGTSATSYSNLLQLVAGDIIDFVVGRGADNSAYASGLEIQARLTSDASAPPPRDCAPVSARGLVAWWRGEGNANDSAGSNHGQLVNGVSFAPGKVGQGFLLDGNSFVLVPDDPSLDLTSEITMEMWFKSETWGEGRTWALMDKRTWNDCNYGAVVSEPWGFQLYYNDPNIWGGDHPGNMFEISSYYPLPSLDVFHHFAGTFRQADSDHIELKTYLDGELVQTRLFSGNLDNTVNDMPVAIGSARGGADGGAWRGIIDEVSLYNRVLSGEEVSAIYHAGSAGKCPGEISPPPPPPPHRCAAITRRGLVSWWRGEGDAKDSAGKNDGLVVGGVGFVPGKVGQGFLFDDNSYILVPDDRSLDLTDEITMEMWFKSETWGEGRTWALMDKRTWTDCNYGAVVSEPWGFQLYYNDPNIWGGDHPGNMFEISSYYPLPSLHVFHHFAGTFRQVDENHIELKTYLDGALVRTRVFSGNLANTVNDMDLAIGSARGGADGGAWRGIIDEISLYNRVLSADEIAAIYNADSAGKCPRPNDNSPPKPHIKGPKHFVVNGAPHPFVISCNGAEAQLTLDGRESSDPDGDALTFAWFAGGAQTPLSTADVLTLPAGIGVSWVTLKVSDPEWSTSETVTFEVITPAEAAAQLSLLLDAADLSRKNIGPLRSSIRAAMDSLERGKIKNGINQLEAFKNKVKAQLGSDHPELSASLTAATEGLIGALGDCVPNEQ